MPIPGPVAVLVAPFARLTLRVTSRGSDHVLPASSECMVKVRQMSSPGAPVPKPSVTAASFLPSGYD